jgi:hypothetical protein
LLDLTGGVNVLLADNEVPSGFLEQVRLLLRDKIQVKDGVIYLKRQVRSSQVKIKSKPNVSSWSDIRFFIGL